MAQDNSGWHGSLQPLLQKLSNLATRGMNQQSLVQLSPAIMKWYTPDTTHFHTGAHDSQSWRSQINARKLKGGCTYFWLGQPLANLHLQYPSFD